ncbi:helix-turn-helix domain-containing protein [Actinacidiphila sp. DG2A-62]|uniref:TetR/AcrR family transcriptional regulator n=1 Tax=Actinacidiphila sp. DG2A-62 TaxID=3108821 RepID=UPI002DB70F7D|nr:helix-turn-helix domain-containing protein [Actinacidiphila sp. DG2A-62]MEC3994439.1 helix-turn-helix domain-containing protein [Actinacidiphila sp. DG2A-62]
MSGRKQFDVTLALDRAMRVFWERGYADASLDALGAATGLGRGSFYGAFGSKDALFRQCLDRYAATYGARYEHALGAHPGEPMRAVEAFFDVVLARIADPALPAGCLIAQSAAQAPTLREENAARVRALLDAQRARVRAALADTTTAAGAADTADAGSTTATDAPAAADAPAAPDAPAPDPQTLDDLACYVVAVNQSLAVLSRAGAAPADLRAVARLACTTVADTLARASARPSPVPST